ncbi:WS/DGAT/MGAT family O-acyltransferase [Nocardia sp. NBC_01388]|uniref:WS/DGAT/MGAT family O-acyltransferase n=1 Tax=Nocardia sp. NBC_01388 TaxID=2903596 RepID=UPI0032561B05
MSSRHTKKPGFLPLLDAFWLWVESPETAMQVAALSIFHADEPAGTLIRRMVDDFRSRPATAGPFNAVISAGRLPLLKRRAIVEDVDIDYHFRHSALPAPGGQRELAILVSRLHTTPLDRRRPMWELHVIEGLEGNRIAVYFKTHHSLMDGVAGVRLMAATYSADPDAPLAPPVWANTPPAWVPQTPVLPSRRTVTVRRLWQCRYAVLKLLRADGSPETPLVGPFQAPHSPLNVPIGPQRRIFTATVALDRVKSLAAATETSVNDIVLEMCASALRRYLIGLGELPDKPLIAMVPVDVRRSGTDGNAVSIILANLATHQADPRTRLATIAASTRAGKQHIKTVPPESMSAYTTLAMSPQFVKQLVPGAASLRPMFNLVISNVPGPKQPMYAAGARLENFFPMSLLFKNEALNITVLSHGGQLDFGFTACRTALPRVQDVAHHTVQALDELESAVCSERS